MAAGEFESDRSVALLRQDLRRLAWRKIRRQPPGLPLDAAEVVEEVHQRLAAHDPSATPSRTRFCAVAARQMRHALVDIAGRRRVHRTHVRFRDAEADAGEDTFNVLALDHGLDRLAARDARAARVVELVVFGGLTLDEVAEVTGARLHTVRADWRHACAWLRTTPFDAP